MSKMKLSDMLADAEQKDQEGQQPKKPEDRASIPAIDVAAKTDNSTLKTQRYREIDPARCRPWALHNRDSVWLTPESCADLIESIRNEGQLDLGLVRPLKDDPDYDYEIIYGVRRWYSVSQLPRKMFMARVTDGNDKECAKLMHVENEQSKDISAMEKGRSYRNMIENGLFRTKTDLAEEFGLSKGYVSFVIKAVEILDHAKLNALLGAHIRDISYKDAKELAVAIEQPKLLERAERAAIELGQNEGLSAKSIMSKLLAAVKDDKREKKAKPSVSLFRKDKKRYAYTAEKPNGTVTITLEPGLKEAAGEDIEAVMERILASVKKSIGVE